MLILTMKVYIYLSVNFFTLTFEAEAQMILNAYVSHILLHECLCYGLLDLVDNIF